MSEEQTGCCENPAGCSKPESGCPHSRLAEGYQDACPAGDGSAKCCGRPNQCVVADRLKKTDIVVPPALREVLAMLQAKATELEHAADHQMQLSYDVLLEFTEAAIGEDTDVSDLDYHPETGIAVVYHG